MRTVPRKIEAFRGPSRSLVTAIGGSCMAISRASSRELGSDVLLSANADDAFALIYQLSDIPSHDLWADGRQILVPAAPKSSFRIVDLNAQVQARPGPDFDSLNIHIPRSALIAIADTAGTGSVESIAMPRGHNGTDPMLQALEQSFLYLLERPDAHHRLVQEHLMLTMLSHVAASYGGMSPLCLATSGGLAPWQVRRAKEALGDDLGKAISLADLAHHCRLSPSHFSRAFKISTGHSPYAWLQRHRLERAKDLLRHGNNALAEIAIRCGFSDQSHFNRTFSRHAGTSPGAWQRAHRSA